MVSPHQSQLVETVQGSIKRCNNHPDNLGCANLQTMPKHSAQHKLHRKDAMLQAAGSIMQEVGEKLTETNSRLCMCRRHNRPIIHIFFTLSLFLLCFSFLSVSFPPFALPNLTINFSGQRLHQLDLSNSIDPDGNPKRKKCDLKLKAMLSSHWFIVEPNSNLEHS